MQVLLRFYNGDKLPQEIPDGIPPGRLHWATAADAAPEREFWLDTQALTEGRNEYREVALNTDGRRPL